MPKDEALLKEIRDRHTYFEDRWREIREERRIDMRYVCGDPWTDEEKKARGDKENPRPCINHDELNQYINQGVNNLRANKRGIKVNPAGNGSSDKSAEFRQDLIRTIEYDSNAQAAYITAAQAMFEGSYGFLRISRAYASNDVARRDASVFNQKIVIKTILNPDSVLYDPDCKEADWSDAKACFVLEPISREEFKRNWPEAEIKDFTSEHMRLAPGWVRDKEVIVAEYWRVETKPVRLFLLPSGEVVDNLESGQQALKSRVVEQKTVVQYMTNGVEILERTEQPGEHIPIIPVIGPERYVDEGGVAKRMIFSLVRLARDPQKSLAYLCSQQMEEAGMTPKSPYVGYRGQFDSDSDAWATATKIPHAYLQADPVVDAATGQVLPLPRREPFTPNFAAYELAKDSARRAIQAAMGISPLPTAAQRDNQKSGVALQRIQAQQEVGSFHFVDNFERALQFAGRVIGSWIPVVYDTEREIALRKPDDSHDMVRINTAEPYPDERTQEPRHFPVEEGDHDYTISTGPSAESQRQAAGDFLDLLVQNLGRLPVSPPQAAKLLSLAIRMKTLGPKGDEMAEIIAPSDKGNDLPPQAMQAIQQLQQQLQALNTYAQQKEAELAELQRKMEAKVVEAESRKEIERMKIEADLAKAEISTKAQNLVERLVFVEDMLRKLAAGVNIPAEQLEPEPAAAGPVVGGQPAPAAAAPVPEPPATEAPVQQ